MRPPDNKNRTNGAVVPVVGSSHIGFQVLHEHGVSAIVNQEGIHSRWHQHAAVDGDLAPARPARNDGTPNPVPNSKTASRLDRPKWLTHVFQPDLTSEAPPPPITTTTTTSPVATSSTKESTRTRALSSRQQQQRNDIPDCQPSRPMRQRSGGRGGQAVFPSDASSTCQPSLPVRQRSGGKCHRAVPSDASNTHATESITDHDEDDDPDEFDDDISDITPEDYSEQTSVILSDSQSYFRRNTNSNGIRLLQDVSASKTRDSNHDSSNFPKMTGTLHPVLYHSYMTLITDIRTKGTSSYMTEPAVDIKHTESISCSIEDTEENRAERGNTDWPSCRVQI